MIRADQIDADFRTLQVGDIFVWKTKKAIDQCVVVGTKYDCGIRVPLAVKAYPKYIFTTVYEVRDEKE